MVKPSSGTLDVIVVGAGAAGLATAIFLARTNSDANVIIVDGARRIGAKILVSGGGRCNVTNVRVTSADFYGGNQNVIRRILAGFDERRAREFFETLGVALHEEEYGKLYPDSNSAETILKALIGEATRRGVSIRETHRVTAINPIEAGFELTVSTESNDRILAAPIVVLATGGRSLPKTGSDGLGYELAQSLGHSVTPTTPALDPLVLEGSFHAQLSGVSHEVTFAIQSRDAKPVRISGPMLWTHFGISGPAALDVSRYWNRAIIEDRAPNLTANFAHGADFNEVDGAFVAAAKSQPRLATASVLHRWLPARVARALCAFAGVSDDTTLGQLTRDARRAVVRALVDWPVPVVRTRGYKFAEVTAGGIPLSEVDASTLESRLRPGLFFAGEIFDVDGRLGGFNFQWSWSSGYAVGTAIGKRVVRRSSS